MSTTIQESDCIRSAPPLHGYVAVSLEVVAAMTPCGFDVFFSDGNSRPKLYRARNSALTIADAVVARHAGTHWFYIKANNRAAYQAQLLARLETIIQDDAVPMTERLVVLRNVVDIQLRLAVQRIQIDATVEASSQAGRYLAQLIVQDSLLPTELIAIARHSNDTFSHVLSTSAYAIYLAIGIGFREPAVLRDIAVATMLHDVGKRFLPERLINSAARLTREDRRLIAEHPQKGYEELHGRPDVSFEQLMVVYQHHERIDGSGYPVGITGAEIHPWARLCAIVDVFEALTGKRSYRMPMTVPQALIELDTMAGTRMDADMVQCWKSLVGCACEAL